jgi:hypothetical protein
MVFLDPVQIEFVDRLSPMHKEHHFRYPQKAAVAELDQPSVAIRITDRILRCAFRAIGGVIVGNSIRLASEVESGDALG